MEQVTSQHLSPGYRSLHILDLPGDLLSENFFEHKVVRHLGWHLGIFKLKNDLRDFWLPIWEKRFQIIPLGLEWNGYESAMRNVLLDFVIPSGISNDYLETRMN